MKPKRSLRISQNAAATARTAAEIGICLYSFAANAVNDVPPIGLGRGAKQGIGVCSSTS